MDKNRPHAASVGSAQDHENADTHESARRHRPRAADPDIQRHPGDYMAGAEGTQHVVQPSEDADEHDKDAKDHSRVKDAKDHPGV